MNVQSDAPSVAVTIADAARRLAVSETTVRRLLASRSLTSVRIGRAVRVLSRSVDEFVDRACNAPTLPDRRDAAAGKAVAK